MKNTFIIFPLIFVISFYTGSLGQDFIARIHYSGGGDWYGNRTIFKNLTNFINSHLNLNVDLNDNKIKLTDKTFFKYPLLYISGHGNIKFNKEEVQNLRDYLLNGGFLWADDDYGMDMAFRREMKKVFPGQTWVEVPFSNPIFHNVFEFPSGLPKIHEHDGGPPKSFALFYKGQMIAFYSWNTDLSDGCEDAEIHNDPDKLKINALKMVTNILMYAISQ